MTLDTIDQAMRIWESDTPPSILTRQRGRFIEGSIKPDARLYESARGPVLVPAGLLDETAEGLRVVNTGRPFEVDPDRVYFIVCAEGLSPIGDTGVPC